MVLVRNAINNHGRKGSKKTFDKLKIICDNVELNSCKIYKKLNFHTSWCCVASWICNPSSVNIFRSALLERVKFRFFFRSFPFFFDIYLLFQKLKPFLDCVECIYFHKQNEEKLPLKGLLRYFMKSALFFFSCSGKVLGFINPHVHISVGWPGIMPPGFFNSFSRNCNEISDNPWLFSK